MQLSIHCSWHSHDFDTGSQYLLFTVNNSDHNSVIQRVTVGPFDVVQ